jgi:O-antigen/teichoic acid export membrane protein
MMTQWHWHSAVAAQGLWSGTSFVIAIYLARHVPIDQFGLFAVGLAMRLLFLAVLGALVLSPLTVVSGRLSEPERDHGLVRPVIVLFLVFSAALCLIGLAGGLLLGRPGFEFAVFVVGGLAVELQRRINFIGGRIHEDTIGGLLNLLLSSGGLMLLSRMHALSLSNVFLSLGTVGLGWAMLSGRRQWLRLSWTLGTRASGSLAEMWKIGRWELGGHLAGYGYAQVSTFLTLGLIGAAGVAVLEVGRQLVMFIQVFLQAAANLWHPRLAQRADTLASEHFAQEIWRLARWQTVVGTTLLVCVLSVVPTLIPLLFPGKEQAYMGAVALAWILALGAICQLLSQHLSFGVTALGRADYGFLTRLTAALLLIPLGYGLVTAFGLHGAAWSRVLGEAIVLVLSVLALDRAARGRGSAMVTPRDRLLNGLKWAN